ncbi:MAG: 34-kDa subunit of RNA polymerase III (C) [Thelocarpon superellum]|nr:MAG: 34-kDa subunit of RNA polymerase III (C) [Thelocarpon superellum]
MLSAPQQASSTPSMADLKSIMYARCYQAYSTETLFGQAEILTMEIIPDDDVHVLLHCAQELVNEGLFKVHQLVGNQAMWKVIMKEDADRYHHMTTDEAIIFGYIESAGREGIWSRTIKIRTNLHQSIMNRCIKNLETHGFIKSIKSVRYPTRIFYMLATLTPSEDVTGGPWFTDGELDDEFVETLCQQIDRYVESKSFHRNPAAAGVSRRPTKTSKTDIEEALEKEFTTPKPKREDKLLHFPPGYQGYPTLYEIMMWLNESGISEVPLAEDHVRQLMDVLYYDGKVARVLAETAYKSLRRLDGGDSGESGSALTDAPCGRCPVFNLCEEDGPVSASNCEYFKDWLES